MIIHQCGQGTSEWHQLRLGIPTASEFDNIITPTGKPSAQADGYMYRLLAERITGAPVETPENKYMAHGQEFEAQAAAAFTFETELETATIGFITTDDGQIGCSPDRIVVGKPRGLEIKCPFMAHVHIGYMVEQSISEKYKPQVQGQIYVAEFEMDYTQSYFAGLPSVIFESWRDDEYVKKLSVELRKFNDKLLSTYADLEHRFGPFERPEQPKVKSPASEALKDAYMRAFKEEWRPTY